MRITKLNYVDEADKIMKELSSQKSRITTSKIRNLLTMSNNLYADVKRSSADKLDEETRSRIQYLRMHVAYEAGRDPKGVGEFVKKTGLLEHIKEIGDSREQLLLVCNYMEALVAYHRFYGGKD